jgi:hypothetical protein
MRLCVGQKLGSVADFIKKFGRYLAEDRSAEAMVEIAVQLM